MIGWRRRLCTIFFLKYENLNLNFTYCRWWGVREFRCMLGNCPFLRIATSRSVLMVPVLLLRRLEHYIARLFHVLISSSFFECVHPYYVVSFFQELLQRLGVFISPWYSMILIYFFHQKNNHGVPKKKLIERFSFYFSIRWYLQIALRSHWIFEFLIIHGLQV
jgi:hypothetical protein